MSNTDVTKNSSASWSIGVIIYIFIVIIAAAIYILFYKGYSEKHEQDEILNSNYAETVTTDITTTIFTSPEETTTSSVTTYTTESSTTHSEVTTSTASEITTKTQTTISAVPYEMYESASLRALEDFMFDNSFNDSVMYGLCDINADGVPELLINYATEADDMTSMYIFFETDYRQAVSFGGSAEICAAQHLIQSFGYGGASVRKIFEMDARGNISSKDELYEEYISVDTMYYALNGIEIGKAQYDELNEYYDSLKWEYVCNTEYRRSSVETPSDSTKDPYAAIKQEILDSVDNEYYRGGNSHLENAPADMVFYAAADRTWIDISNAEILEGPDVNYASCIAYTSSFQLIGENTNWYYVMWTEGAGAFTHPCYGFIRKVV